jgi:hypothetical protein
VTKLWLFVSFPARVLGCLCLLSSLSLRATSTYRARRFSFAQSIFTVWAAHRISCSRSLGLLSVPRFVFTPTRTPLPITIAPAGFCAWTFFISERSLLSPLTGPGAGPLKVSLFSVLFSYSVAQVLIFLRSARPAPLTD